MKILAFSRCLWRKRYWVSHYSKANLFHNMDGQHMDLVSGVLYSRKQSSSRTSSSRICSTTWQSRSSLFRSTSGSEQDLHCREVIKGGNESSQLLSVATCPGPASWWGWWRCWGRGRPSSTSSSADSAAPAHRQSPPCTNQRSVFSISVTSSDQSGTSIWPDLLLLPMELLNLPPMPPPWLLGVLVHVEDLQAQ